MRVVCGIGIFLLLASSGAFAQTHVETIQIDSRWGGLGPYRESHLTIARKGDSYEANGSLVDTKAVGRLLDAVREYPVPEPEAANLGVTAAWLREYFEKAEKTSWITNYESGTAAQKELFRISFEARSNLAGRLAEVYRSYHTDDNPGIRVMLTLVDGSTLSVCSNSQHPFMLPWLVGQGATSVKTYNANISRALTLLLPRDFTNKERVVDDNGLAESLGNDTGSTIEDKWNMLGAQSAAGPALSVLRRSYEVRIAEVNSYFQLAYGEEWKDIKPEEENLHVNLWHEGLPRNFVVAATLLRKGGVVQGAAKIVEQAPAYERVVFDVPWWREYFQKHPNEVALLYLVHGRSLSDRTMKIFAADMKVVGRQDLAAKVRAVQSQVALLQTGRYPRYGQGDYWIVLPDRTTILWRWQSPHHVLGWEAKSLPAKECSSDGTLTGGCAGVVISPEGSWIK